MCARRSPRIMVTGAAGQIGSELTLALRGRYGNENVVATGHKTKPSPKLRDSGPFEFIDVTRRETIEAVVDKFNVDTIYHLAAILSAVGEEKPHLAWDVNMNGLYNILEVAREREGVRVFCPSSIAAFGPETPRENTPQETVLRPKTRPRLQESSCATTISTATALTFVAFATRASSAVRRHQAAAPPTMPVRYSTRPSNIRSTLAS